MKEHKPNNTFSILQVILVLCIAVIIFSGSYFTLSKNNKFYQHKEGEVIVSEQIPSMYFDKVNGVLCYSIENSISCVKVEKHTVGENK